MSRLFQKWETVDEQKRRLDANVQATMDRAAAAIAADHAYALACRAQALAEKTQSDSARLEAARLWLEYERLKAGQ